MFENTGDTFWKTKRGKQINTLLVSKKPLASDEFLSIESIHARTILRPHINNTREKIGGRTGGLKFFVVTTERKKNKPIVKKGFLKVRRKQMRVNRWSAPTMFLFCCSSCVWCRVVALRRSPDWKKKIVGRHPSRPRLKENGGEPRSVTGSSGLNTSPLSASER